MLLKFQEFQFFNKTLHIFGQRHTTAAERSCPVCYQEDIPVTQLAITPCAHVYCISCLKTTVELRQKCALCRQPVEEKDIHEVCTELGAQADVELSLKMATSTTDEKRSLRYKHKTKAKAKAEQRNLAKTSKKKPITGGGCKTLHFENLEEEEQSGSARFHRYGSKIQKIVLALLRIKSTDPSYKV